MNQTRFKIIDMNTALDVSGKGGFILHDTTKHEDVLCAFTSSGRYPTREAAKYEAEIIESLDKLGRPYRRLPGGNYEIINVNNEVLIGRVEPERAFFPDYGIDKDTVFPVRGMEEVVAQKQYKITRVTLDRWVYGTLQEANDERQA